jgi:hypothetical protein
LAPINVSRTFGGRAITTERLRLRPRCFISLAGGLRRLEDHTSSEDSMLHWPMLIEWPIVGKLVRGQGTRCGSFSSLAVENLAGRAFVPGKCFIMQPRRRLLDFIRFFRFASDLSQLHHLTLLFRILVFADGFGHYYPFY